MVAKVCYAADLLSERTGSLPVNYQAFYSSSSATGSYRDSRGYALLREKAYAAQRRLTEKTVSVEPVTD